MPAHNVNTAALEQVVEAARRFETLAETLNLSPVDNEDFELSTSLLMMDKVLADADPNGATMFLENGRDH
tara:strand:+ start:765 stop:974 length:210 start_codon:yes stop_codon:yes gene_type:complete